MNKWRLKMHIGFKSLGHGVDSKIHCPYCYSADVRSAGYGNRLECQKCGKVFT